MPKLSYDLCKEYENILLQEITKTNHIVSAVRQMAKEKNKELIVKLREIKQL